MCQLAGLRVPQRLLLASEGARSTEQLQESCTAQVSELLHAHCVTSTQWLAYGLLRVMRPNSRARKSVFDGATASVS